MIYVRLSTKQWFYLKESVISFSCILWRLMPKNKGRAKVFLDPHTYYNRDKMRTLIETEQYFHDVVENNLICINFASLSRFGIS